MRKIVSVMLVLTMALGGVMTAFGAENAAVPSDVKGTTYEEAVKALLAADVVSGYKDGTYRPANTLTRAEACTFLVNYLAPTEEELAAAPASGFGDVKGWAEPYVNYAVQKGIVSGYKDGTFRPSKEVTYQEMAAMTVNALGIDAKELTGTWPLNYVNKAKELGMYENISVAKKNGEQANRGDVAEMVYSLIKYKDKDVSEIVSERMARSEVAMADVKSMTYEMKMDMVMSAQGETVDTSTNMKMDMIAEPLSMYAAATISAQGESEKAEYYYMTEGDQLVMYMQMEGEWYKMVLGSGADLMEAIQGQNPAGDMEMYLTAFDNIRMEGRDIVNGKPATKIYCELNDAYIEELMEMTGILGQDALEMTEEEIEMMRSIFSMMKGFGYEIWLDNESDEMVKVRMDMTDMMNGIIKEALKEAATTDPEAVAELEDLKIDKTVVEMTLSNVNSVKEIKLPEAAKNAQSIVQ